MIEISIEINEIENRKTIEMINKTKCLFFKKINKIVKNRRTVTKKNRDRT